LENNTPKKRKKLPNFEKWDSTYSVGFQVANDEI
jgi:hypothetical protein